MRAGGTVGGSERAEGRAHFVPALGIGAGLAVAVGGGAPVCLQFLVYVVELRRGNGGGGEDWGNRVTAFSIYSMYCI